MCRKREKVKNKIKSRGETFFSFSADPSPGNGVSLSPDIRLDKKNDAIEPKKWRAKKDGKETERPQVGAIKHRNVVVKD